MRTLTDLKRAIKPGLRLLCIENTKRPELNGKERIVSRVQGNAFTWKHAEGSDERESWTYYEKAAAYTFDGSNRVTWLIDPKVPDYGRVTLEVLG
jgi:hypothetical protein